MTAPWRRVWIGLGANLGDPAANVLAAAHRLSAEPGTRAPRISDLYETAPWGRTDQPWFVNAVVELETTLAPDALLDRLLAIELELGRVRSDHWGPRTIDLDYLLDERATADGARLTLPHRELENRAFVLAPLAELRPGLLLPSGQTIEARLRDLSADQAVRRMGTMPRWPAP